ncbi:MAG: hypothetical protein M1837_006192 [Sclerophora amabilis]|nr:MAG: hypothetical protein M1837_006192 [Sclerophora amabilis]
MVQTRRQSRANGSPNPPESLADQDVESNEKKRQNGSNGLLMQTSRKRRRLEPDTSTADISTADISTGEPGELPHDSPIVVHEDLPVRQKEAGESEENLQSGRRKDSGSKVAQMSPEFESTTPLKNGIAPAEADEDETPSQPPEVVPRTTRSKASQKGSRRDSKVNGSPAVVIYKPKRSEADEAKPSGSHDSSHVRFDNDEPHTTQISDAKVSEPKSDQAPTPANEQPTESSDDEAPEAESLSTGQQRAKSLALEASKAAEGFLASQVLTPPSNLRISQEQVARQKRKALDARLKSQASQGKKKKRKLDRDAGETPADPHDHTLLPHHEALTSTSLPALLPDEILAIDPAERPPTPPPQSTALTKHHPPQKRKFVFPEEKKPKDFKRNGVRVRVLEGRTDQFLAPKAVKASAGLREQWLMGQRGGKRAGEREGGMERRKVGQGFLRR